VPAWSLTNIAGMNINDYCAMNHMECQQQGLDDAFTQTRDAAYHIIERKGATYYAIASGLTRIVEAILRDQNTVLSVSSLISDYYDIDDVFLSLPSIIDRGGLERFIRLQLDPKEVDGLRNSARVLKDILKTLDLG